MNLVGTLDVAARMPSIRANAKWSLDRAQIRNTLMRGKCGKSLNAHDVRKQPETIHWPRRRLCGWCDVSLHGSFCCIQVPAKWLAYGVEILGILQGPHDCQYDGTIHLMALAPDTSNTSQHDVGNSVGLCSKDIRGLHQDSGATGMQNPGSSAVSGCKPQGFGRRARKQFICHLLRNSCLFSL